MKGCAAAGHEVPMRRCKSGKKRFLHFWEVVRALIAEAGNRFPGRLSAVAFAAHGNQFCTVESLS